MITYQGRLRRKARRQSLDGLYAMQNSLCHWCKSQTAIVGNIPLDRRVRTGAHTITWRDGDEIFTACIATIDHLNPIRNNGDNHPGNLVMACKECNEKRTKTESPVPVEIRRVCPDCLRPKTKRAAKCQRCQIEQTIAWLLHHGWVEVPGHHEGHTKFRDPVTADVHVLRHACETLKRRLDQHARPEPEEAAK